MSALRWTPHIVHTGHALAEPAHVAITPGQAVISVTWTNCYRCGLVARPGNENSLVSC